MSAAMDERGPRDAGRRGAILATMRGERGPLRWIIVLVLVFLGTQAIFLAATTAAAAIPNQAIVSQLMTGAEQRLWDTTDYPLDGIGHATERFGFAGVSDAFTQCIALTMGLGGDDTSGPLMNALNGPHLGTCSKAVPAVERLAAGEAPEESFMYNRYWNGFTVLTRPLLAWGGVGAVRLAVGLIFVSGIAAASIALARRTGPWTTIALLTPVLVSTNLMTQVASGFSHALSFGVAAWGVALAVRLSREPLPLVIIGGALVGAVFNFVDFLLNPPLAWALFVFAVVCSRWRSLGSPTSSLWKTSAAASLAWIAGYGATWVTRWVLAVIAFGDSAWAEIMGVVGNRLQGQYEDLVVPGFAQPFVRNVLFWYGTVPTARLVLWVAAAVTLVCIVVLLARRDARRLGIALALASPALLIVLWLELLNNHSQIHMFFVYRSIPALVGVVLAGSVAAATEPRSRSTRARGVLV